MAFGTVAEIVNDTALEVGLGGNVTTPPDPFLSTDPNVLQMLTLLKSCGRELVRERNWNYLRKEHSFTTVYQTSTYAIPAGFLNMIDQTGWVRTTRLPLGGPVTPQEWQYLKARLTGVTITLLFRPITREIKIFPDTNTPGDLTVAFEYQSSLWLAPEADPTADPTLEAPAAAGDVVWFDTWLMSRKLKLRFMEAKGLDTTDARKEYMMALDMAASDDSQSPIRSLTGQNFGVLMGERNVPITGFGNP